MPRPHPAFEQHFQAYCNYLRALAGDIQERYGAGAPARLSGVHAGVLAHPAVHRVQRRKLPEADYAELETALRKGWAFLRRVHHEIADPDLYDEEANALLPYSAWYAVHHVGRAFAIAARHAPATDHTGLLHDLGRTVVLRGLLPAPWHMWCEGCPQTKAALIKGTTVGPRAVHVLSRPSSESIEARIGLLLKTTREKELERIFRERRQHKVQTGRKRRNLSDDDKNQIAGRIPPTTIFDFLYRLRTRASYGEADLFVLGSRDVDEARRLAIALAIVCDATVAALEALAVAYAGPEPIAQAASRYAARTGSELIAARAQAWQPRR